jgi:hypothetical protein
VANLKNASFSLKNESVEEFVCGGENPEQPALLAATNQHCEIKAEQLWSDDAVLTLAQTPSTAITVIIGPKGTTTGNPKYTFSNVVIIQLDLKWDQKSAVSNSFSAKGILSAVGNF